MSEVEFSDKQIRIELKRLVEREKKSMLERLEQDSREGAKRISERDPGEEKIQEFNRKLQQTKEMIETSFQAMLDFIDRN
jgi:hypothetical protein